MIRPGGHKLNSDWQPPQEPSTPISGKEIRNSANDYDAAGKPPVTISGRFMYVDRTKDTKPEHREVFEAVDRVPFPAGWTGSLTVTVIAGKAKEFVTVREDVAPRS